MKKHKISIINISKDKPSTGANTKKSNYDYVCRCKYTRICYWKVRENIIWLL